jgi:UrcA family protein
MNRSINAIVIGLSLVGVAQTAAAREEAPRQKEVFFADLNLNKEAGAAALLKRLTLAARSVCDDKPLGPMNMSHKNSAFACRKATLQKAVADVNHPVVTAMYENTRGRVFRMASR